MYGMQQCVGSSMLLDFLYYGYRKNYGYLPTYIQVTTLNITLLG